MDVVGSTAYWDLVGDFLKKNRNKKFKLELAHLAFPDVSKRTIERRSKMGDWSKKKRGPPPKVGWDVEKAVVDFCIDMANMGFPQFIDDVVRKVRDAAARLGDDPSSIGGKTWIKLFRARWPLLVDRLATKSGKERIHAATEDNVLRFYDLSKLALHAVPAVRPADTYVIDECGVFGECRDRKVCPL